jgi:hypothetical protein
MYVTKVSSPFWLIIRTDGKLIVMFSADRSGATIPADRIKPSTNSSSRSSRANLLTMSNPTEFHPVDHSAVS